MSSMRTKHSVLLAAAMVMLLGVVAMAHADPASPVLTAGKTAITYPHSTYLVSTVSTPSALMERKAGSDDWVEVTELASGTVRIAVNQPTSTVAFQIVSDAQSSDVVTISVGAQLSKPQVNAKGRRQRPLTIKGWMAPREVGATVDLTFYKWTRVSRTVVTVIGKHGHVKTRIVVKYQWVQTGDTVTVATAPKGSNMMKWSYEWSPTATGVFKIQVSHQDVAHAYSSASAVTVIRK
jgi:hypothetical protein